MTCINVLFLSLSIINSHSPLHCAAYSGSMACCSELIKVDAFVNQADNEGITPLHWACAGGNSDCVQYLLSCGANPNAMDYTDQRLTPLDYAILASHQELAQSLIAQGALTIASIQELAATMIQKVVRGHLVRKRSLLSGIKKSKGEEEHTLVERPVSEATTSDISSTAGRRRYSEILCLYDSYYNTCRIVILFVSIILN